MKATHWKVILILAVVLGAVYLVWPRGGRQVLNMRLGLDLQGGSHLVLRVETLDAVDSETDVAADRGGNLLRREGFPDARARRADGVHGEFIITGVAADRLGDARALIEDEFGSWSVSSDEAGIRLRMPAREQAAVEARAVRQALNTIRNRVDEFGVSEPVIQRIGGEDSHRILVQLPGVEDPVRVKNLIQEKGQLALRLLYYTEEGGGPFIGVSEDAVVQQLGGDTPPGVEVLPEVEPGDDAGQIVQYVAVEKTAAVTGADLQDARPAQGQWGDTVVSFTLRVAAAERFARFTRENINRQMAIVLDGKINTAPSIRNEISTQGQIEGNYSYQDAEDLALVLRAGALPAGVRTIEERTVGPSLGRDSIVSGVRAVVVGFVFVMLFMVIYYRLSGINAVVALLLNLLLVAAAMAMLEATLTLPGIGGFILTVGMAVDANVLIFERIREELSSGKTVRGALDAGFSKALSAILDANVTTLIAALFLFQYGTGPVRGFAVTLSIGILASMFTAIVVSRIIFDTYLGDRVVHKLSI